MKKCMTKIEEARVDLEERLFTAFEDASSQEVIAFMCQHIDTDILEALVVKLEEVK